MFKVAILGASGYTGLELVRLISMHPKFEIEYLSGDSKSGMKFGDVYPGLQYLKLPNLLSVSEINYEEIDAVFCALPHTKSANIINNLPTKPANGGIPAIENNIIARLPAITGSVL